LNKKSLILADCNVEQVNAINPPPPRYAHSSVVFEDHMYIFGGERSAYAFNDVWVFSFATAEWEFVTPVTGPAPEGRCVFFPITNPFSEPSLAVLLRVLSK